MRKYLIFIAILASFGLGSCRCATPPPIGPVETESSERPADTAQTVAPDRDE